MAGAVMHDDQDAAKPPAGFAVSDRREGDLGFLAALTTKLAVAQGEAEILGGFSLTAVERFCATCAIHLIGADGALTLGGFAHQPRDEAGRVYQAISRLVASKLGPLQQVSRGGDPLLLRPEIGAQAPLAAQQRQGQYLLDAFEGRALLLVPLLVTTSVIGVVSFAPPPERESYDDAAVETAAVAVRHLALALENARSIARERRVTERFGDLEKAKNELFTTLEPEQMLQRVAESLVGPLADGIIVYTVDRERLQVIAAAHRRTETAALVAGLIGTQPLKPEGERLLLEHLRTHESVVTNVLSHDDLQALFRSSSLPLIEALQPRAEIVVPFFANDVLAGAIVAYASRDDFGPSDIEVFQEIGRVSTLALDHARSFARERRLTKVLQEATLPAGLPTIKGAIVSAIYSPAATELKVGGDWYDAFSLDEDRVLLTIGDVTGHGLQASAIMSKLRHTLNAVALYERNHRCRRKRAAAAVPKWDRDGVRRHLRFARPKPGVLQRRAPLADRQARRRVAPRVDRRPRPPDRLALDESAQRECRNRIAGAGRPARAVHGRSDRGDARPDRGRPALGSEPAGGRGAARQRGTVHRELLRGRPGGGRRYPVGPQVRRRRALVVRRGGHDDGAALPREFRRGTESSGDREQRYRFGRADRRRIAR
jgi:GAF domain-containing protein